METFAEQYFKCSPYSFTSADTAYVFAYSVILLNTDAHNNMVKGKVCLRNLVSWNAIINGYMKLGDFDYARVLLNEMPVSNLITWNAIIAGLEWKV
ncbi:hypothetical protein ACOSQ3_015136 [Xanthoceras sorbifolium]